MSRVVCWFSCGAASAVATKLALKKYGERVVIAYIDVGGEHPDNERFVTDCERWFGKSIQRLKSAKYKDARQLWRERRFIVTPKGALCTTELKKVVRFAFQRPDDIQVYGYTLEERDRATRFRLQNFEVTLETPLIDEGLTKQECFGLISQAGIEIPAMYKLGFQNNNCIGCCKGGMGYWNRVRVHFPPVFEETALIERELGFAILRDGNGTPVFLDELDPARGNIAGEPNFECNLLCQSVDLEAGRSGERG